MTLNEMTAFINSSPNAPYAAGILVILCTAANIYFLRKSLRLQQELESSDKSE